MEQIMITKPDGSIVPIAGKSTATAIKSAKQTWELLGNDVVGINVESPFPQTYGIGDRITVFGRIYKLNRLPKIKKTGMHAFSYDLEFEGVQYDLIRVTYDLTIDTTHNQLQDIQANALTGDLRRFATTLIANANRVFPDKYALGACPETIGDKTLTFGEPDNCLSVLQKLCAEFGTEFEMEQTGDVNIIHFKKVGQIIPYTFEYGKGKGLYSLERQNVDSSNIVTRLKVFGASKNITNKYRAQRLCLPGCTKGQSCMEKPGMVAKYGIWEATKYFEDVFPSRTGTITTLGDSVLKFVDADMFDLNETEADGKTTKYLLPGISAKVHFNTGNLAGYEFEIKKEGGYNHATHTFTLVKLTDERDDEFPSERSSAFQFSTGDEYKLIDVALPPNFEMEAESRLAEEGETYYDQNSQPKVQYGLSITEDYLKKLVGRGTTVNIFTPGDYIPIKDTDIEVDKSVRIKSLTRNVLDEYDYSLTLSDTVTTSITNRAISELIDMNRIISINNLKDPVRAQANWRSSREVLNMVFDPEGDYYTGKIKPESIDTIALSIGAKSMQFGLTNTVLQPNYNGNRNVIKVQGGVLTHYTINEKTTMSWILADNTTAFDDDRQACYIYAKCQRTGTAGSIIFSINQIKVEQDINFYHFWIGVVNSVDVELHARSVSLSYGFTMINGRFIKTGRIESGGGDTYFDLDNGEIGGKILFKSGSSGYDNLTDKPNLSPYNEVVNYIDNVLPAQLSELQRQIDGQIESWFYHYDPALSNYPASDWTTVADREKHLDDTFTNLDSGQSWRFAKNAGNIYVWTLMADSAATQALVLAGQALDTADGKRRVFVATPYTPYDIGDLWTQGASGDLMRCLTARQTGGYVASDWSKASKYTDDTTALTAAQAAAEAQTTATAAGEDASAARESALEAQTIAAQAQSDATTAKAVTDNFTTINGGLVLTSLIKMLKNNVESGGLSANFDNILGIVKLI